MASVRLDHISKRFGHIIALDNVDLTIDSGEIFFLLGPSGCGKTTLLRIVAGLHEPTSGRVLFDGQDVTNLPTAKRNAVMCFQSYALWPHMTVEQNIRFGVELHGLSHAEQKQRVQRSAEARADGVAAASAAESTVRRTAAGAWRWHGHWSCIHNVCCWMSR